MCTRIHQIKINIDVEQVKRIPCWYLTAKLQSIALYQIFSIESNYRQFMQEKQAKNVHIKVLE